jgi:hypothetical protein
MSFVSLLQQDSNFSAALSKFCVQFIIYVAGTIKYSSKINLIKAERRQIVNKYKELKSDMMFIVLIAL